MNAPTLNRDAVKNMLLMMQVFESCVIKVITSDGETAPADLVTAYYLCKTDIEDFLNNTTEEIWEGPVKHAQFIIFLHNSRDTLKKITTAHLLREIEENGGLG